MSSSPDFRALRAQLRDAGFFEPAPGRLLVEWGAHVALLTAGAVGFFAVESLVARLGCVLLVSLGSFGVATNTHTASHQAAFRSRRWNDVLTFVGYPLVSGFSATYWHHKHVRRHHRAPNVVGIDDDHDLAPVFAIQSRQLEAATGWRRRWYELQWVFVPLAIGLIGVGMARDGLRFLGKSLRHGAISRQRLVVDALALMGHLGLWVLLPLALGASGSDVAALYAGRLVCLGYLLFAGFAPAHLPAEARLLEARPLGTEAYVRSITLTSLNIDTGAIGRFFCSGVDFQIEHHLFPRVSHVHYPRLAPVVRAWCHTHGLPYRTLGWGEGVREALRVFMRPKPTMRLEP